MAKPDGERGDRRGRLRCCGISRSCRSREKSAQVSALARAERPRQGLMPDTFWHGITIGCLALTACGCAYALAATTLVRRFTRDGAPTATAFPGITVLKPLHGAEATLYDNLRSFCDQDYPGPVQLLFGVQNAD